MAWYRDATVEMSNLTISGCRLNDEGAPIEVYKGSQLMLSHVTFEDNLNLEGSAGVVVGRDSELRLLDVLFRRNRAGTASAVEARKCSVVNIKDSTFELLYGLKSAVSVSDAKDIKIEGTRFLKNQALSFGGGAVSVVVWHDMFHRLIVVCVQGEEVEAAVRIERTEFHDNRALDRTTGGGAVMLVGNFSTVLNDVQFVDNWAARRGGGLYAQGTPGISIQNSFFVENKSNFTGGGGMYAEVGQPP